MLEGGFVVNTDDLAEAEQQLSASFGLIRLQGEESQPLARTRVWRSYVGPLRVDDVEFSYDMSYEMEPTDDILLCRVQSGVLEETVDGQRPGLYGAGDVVAFGAIPGRPFAGSVRSAHYHLVAVPRRCLVETAGIADSGAEHATLCGSRPISAEANQHLVDAIDHLRHGVLANPSAAREPLVGSAVLQYLAAAMLASFPVMSRLPSGGDEDNHKALRRATSFVDDHVVENISVADIAHTARVSPQAVSAMFRRHQQTSPTNYLRRARLRHAHEALLKADPAATSVADIAHRLGFWHLQRFRTLYAKTYGVQPENTLGRP